MHNSRSTRTLSSTDFELVDENDRVYGNTTYYMPCDEAEQDRLAIQHQVFVYALKGKLTTTPLLDTHCRVLDLCTGPGNWAVAVAQQFPKAEVVGVDMAVWDIETTEADGGGGNVTWEIDDLDIWGVESDMENLTNRLERYDPFLDPTARNPARRNKTKDSNSHPQSGAETSFPSSPSYNPDILDPDEQPGWHFAHPFNLIHVRNCKGIFAYWEDVYAEIYKNLAPGGWVEVCDYELLLPEMINTSIGSPSSSSSNNHLTPQKDTAPMPTIRKLYLAMMQASFKSGRPLGTFYMHPTYLEDAGFKDIRTTYVNVPVGQWPADPEQRKIGKMFLVVVIESFESNLLRLLTKWGDKEKVWTREEVMLEVERGKREIMEWTEGMQDGGNEAVWCANFKWVVGRKSKNA
jgi:SAM-dependent methyltransferase